MVTCIENLSLSWEISRWVQKPNRSETIMSETKLTRELDSHKEWLV